MKEYADSDMDFSPYLQLKMDEIVNGGEISIPRGVYYLGSSIYIPKGVRLTGETSFSTVLVCGKISGDFIYMSSDAQIDNIKITAKEKRQSGAYIKIYGNGVKVENFVMENYSVGIWIKGFIDKPVTFPLIRNGNFFNPSLKTKSGMIVCENYANAVISQVIGSSNVDQVQPSFGIRLLNGDTCLISDVDIVKHKNAILIDPPDGYVVYATSVSNSLFDSSVGESSGRISAENGGSVFSTKFSNCWFGISTENGLAIQGGSGKIDGVSLSGSEFIDNGKDGCRIDGPNVKNIVVNGGWSTGNGGDGISIRGASNIIINGVIIAASSGRSGNGGVGIRKYKTTNTIISSCILADNLMGDIYEEKDENIN